MIICDSFTTFEKNIKLNNMKYLFTFFLSLLMSLFAFSQVITFECNNEIITVSFNEIANDFNTYLDWNGDGVIDEEDYIIYLSELYDCEDNNDIFNNDGCYDDTGNLYTVGEVLIVSDDDCENYTCVPNDNMIGFSFVLNYDLYPEGCQGDDTDEDDNNNDWGDDDNWDDIFVFECNGEEVVIELSNMTDSIDYESYIDSIMSDYDCEEWDWEDDNNWDEDNNEWGDIEWVDEDWSDFEWSFYWDDLDLELIDWGFTPWDNIIDLDISPEDFIDYIISIFGQSFVWDEFISFFNNSVGMIEGTDKPIILTQSVNIIGQNMSHENQLIIQIHNNGIVNKKFIINYR